MQSIVDAFAETFHISTRKASILVVLCAAAFLGLAAFTVRMLVITDYHNISYSQCYVSAKPEPYRGGFRSSYEIYPITTSCGSFEIIDTDLNDNISLNGTYELVTGPKTTLEQPYVISAVPSKK